MDDIKEKLLKDRTFWDKSRSKNKNYYKKIQIMLKLICNTFDTCSAMHINLITEMYLENVIVQYVFFIAKKEVN